MHNVSTVNFKKYLPAVYILAAVIFLCLIFSLVLLRPISKGDTLLKELVVERGMGLSEIANRLTAQNLIRSTPAFKLFSIITFRAHLLKPGDYFFSASMSTPEIIGLLVKGGRDEVTVVISEGKNVSEIDALLSQQKIIRAGELISLDEKKKLEGSLFPDTYRFLVGSDVNVVLEKIRKNFQEKTKTLLPAAGRGTQQTLILASLIEKEVPNYDDRKIVADIILKRLAAGWPLQVDATICYIKTLRSSSQPSLGFGGQSGQVQSCYPLTLLDFKIDSPYNTYLYKGLPPAPISNPGVSAISAALHPTESPYWYYLSDPKTGKTYFAKTLEEQKTNKTKFLK